MNSNVAESLWEWCHLNSISTVFEATFSDALKRQKYDTWIAIWLNHFENNVIWTVFKGVLELHYYISVFWFFSGISMISEFSFLGIGLKTKTRK